MSILQAAKNMNIQHNVSFRVLDASTRQVVKEYSGHNQATNSLLLGIAHYLKGDGILNQAADMLGYYIPRYISLGTMGLINQDEDENGLPVGIGVSISKDDSESTEEYEIRRFQEYMRQVPGYGADGYDSNQNNSRQYLGLGPAFADRSDTSKTIQCELVSTTFPRSPITYRNIIPEVEAELPETIDVVFGAMVSTGALAQFREPGKDYVYITEAGLWSEPNWISNGNNGLLAGYRITPPDSKNWDMTVPENRDILRQNIIRVGINQVVQVIWKIQIGSLDHFCNPEQHNAASNELIWHHIT